MRGLLADGAGDRDRTGDLRVTSALLYQLSYAGSRVIVIKSGKLFGLADLEILEESACCFYLSFF